MLANKVASIAESPGTRRPVERVLDAEPPVRTTTMGYLPSPPGLGSGPIRRSPLGEDILGGTAVPPSTLEILRRRRGGVRALPERAAAPVSEHLGVDLSRVRVLTDAEANAVSRSLHATAFTHGTDIYFDEVA